MALDWRYHFNSMQHRCLCPSKKLQGLRQQALILLPSLPFVAIINRGLKMMHRFWPTLRQSLDPSQKVLQRWVTGASSSNLMLCAFRVWNQSWKEQTEESKILPLAEKSRTYCRCCSQSSCIKSYTWMICAWYRRVVGNFWCCGFALPLLKCLGRQSHITSSPEGWRVNS